MEPHVVAVVALILTGFALLSGRLEDGPLTPPLFFTLMGLALGPAWLDVVRVDPGGEVFQLLAELTLVLVLFTDASRIHLRVMRQGYPLPLRLLSLGLPLCVVAGWLAALPLLDGLTGMEMAVVAAILAPTDAALGQAMMNSPLVPVRMRQAINVESGLNDGLVLPVVLVTMSLASVNAPGHAPAYWLHFALAQVTLGPGVGLLVGWLGGRALVWALERAGLKHVFQDVAALGLSLLAYALAETLGGNGLLGAFAAGLALGNTARRLGPSLWEFAEAEGQLLTLITFLAFGAMMLGPALAALDGPTLAYALASLTVVRMAPVALSMLGMGFRPLSALFVGWFGPRGLASILYVLLVANRFQIPGQERILQVVGLVVGLSILLHGVSAGWVARGYARALQGLARPLAAPEYLGAEELPLRLPPAHLSGRRLRPGHRHHDPEACV